MCRCSSWRQMAAGGLRGTEAGNFHTRSAIILRLKAQVTAYRTMPFRSAPERPLSEGRREWAMHPASRRTRSCHAVADMVPSNLPPEVRDDIVQFIFMALLEGSLRRDEVKARIGQFVKEHNREANKHDTGKYGLISLDAPIFADGSTNPGRHNQPRPLGLDARGGPKVDGTARQSLSRQVAQHGLAGLF